MSDLMNLLLHKRNSKVLVNGTVYDIDGEGVCKDVSEDDAAKLLGSKHWAEYDPKALDPKKVAKAKRGSRVQLVTDAGEVLPPKEDDSKPEIELTDADVIKDASEEFAPPTGDDATVEIKDPPLPDEGEEWEDPQVHYSLDWLRACAKAYSVRGADKFTNKEKLVARINEHMYEEEE